jgi:hypothetical protein
MASLPIKRMFITVCGDETDSVAIVGPGDLSCRAICVLTPSRRPRFAANDRRQNGGWKSKPCAKITSWISKAPMSGLAP